MSVSIVIPAHNASAFITETLRSILSNATVSDVLVVDDGSSDPTPDLVRAMAQQDHRVLLIRADANRGAGVARNIGFAAVRGDYTMFLDSDDFLASNAIDEIHGAISASTADFATYGYKFCTHGPADATTMHPSDRRFWDGLPAGQLSFQVSFAAASGILTTVNYPWNKIARTSYLRRIGLRFSESFVFNDMLGHWMSYLNATDVLLYKKPLIFHRIDPNGQPQLTTTSGKRRLEVFKAFSDVEDLFLRNPAHLRHYHFYLFYKLEVLAFIAQGLPAELYPQFHAAVIASYHHLDAERLALANAVMPDVARMSLQAKTAPAGLFATPVAAGPATNVPSRGSQAPATDFESKAYWQKRYLQGGNSGAGSHGRLADFKAQFINAFVVEHAIESVIEFGCGDGDQLSKYKLPTYTGVDVSELIVARCRERFAAAASKSFMTYDDLHAAGTADMAISIDVIFHLVEDDVFERYMNHLFAFGRRYVVIYSSDCDASWPDRHVRHRRVTAHVERFFPEWSLAAHVPNIYPYDHANPNMTSFADFFVFTNPWAGPLSQQTTASNQTSVHQ